MTAWMMAALVVVGGFGPFPAWATIGDLSQENAQVLEEQRKRMAPSAYAPANAPGCMRWKGRALLSRSNGQETACVQNCALALVDDDGRSARWEFSGARCRGGVAHVPAVPVALPVEAPVKSQVPASSPNAVVLPSERVVPRGQARNYRGGDEPIQGPAPGYRAVRK